MTPTLMVYYIERDVYVLSKDIFSSWYIYYVRPFCMRSQSKAKASNTHVFQTKKELPWVGFKLTLKSRQNYLPAELPGQLS